MNIDTNHKNEIWRPVRGYEGKYEVSSKGRVRSLDRKVFIRSDSGGYYRNCKGRMLTPATDPKGYKFVTLCGRQFRVHMLMAIAFLGDPPGEIGTAADEWQVNHVDGCKTHNTLPNIEWVTSADNTRHAYATGMIPVGEKSHLSSLSRSEVEEIIWRLSQGESQQDIADDYGVSQPNISMINQGKSWRHVPRPHAKKMLGQDVKVQVAKMPAPMFETDL